MNHTTPRVVVVGGVVAGLFWFTLTLYIVNSSLGNTNQHQTALNLPASSQLWSLLRPTVPEGWGFFTKSPRDDDFYIYSLQTGTPVSIFRGPVLRAINAFGLERAPRAQGAEYGLLIQSLQAANWSPCDGDLARCAARLPAHTLRNPSSHPLLCGPLLMMQQPPLPWAWTGFHPQPQMPMNVVRVKVTCSGGAS